MEIDMKRLFFIIMIAAGLCAQGQNTLSLGGGSAPDVVRMKLAPGCTAVIVSDGVIADGDDEWLKALLLRGGEDMKTLAKATLREAERLYGGSDDMTVVSLRVEERA